MKKGSLLAFGILAAHGLAQNVVSESPRGPTLPPAQVDPGLAARLVRLERKKEVTVPNTPEHDRVRAKLAAHVEGLVRGWPWRPFHCTLGISGVETYFDHPDEVYYVLSLALPHLPQALHTEVANLLANQLTESPPYALEGFDREVGRTRERYDVPAKLRLKGRGDARSLFGIAAYAAYVEALERDGIAVANQGAWERTKERVRPILEKPYQILARKDGTKADGAEVLNGDLTGLIAFARMADKQGDKAAYGQAIGKIGEAAQLRIDLERTNSRMLVPASTASKQLHHYKLAQFGYFHPDVVRIFSEEERTVAAKRLSAFRDERPGWWMAFAERFVGGENYITPPHLSHALFVGAALLEQVDAKTLSNWIDVPWCEADLYFIEKCTLALRAP